MGASGASKQFHPMNIVEDDGDNEESVEGFGVGLIPVLIKRRAKGKKADLTISAAAAARSRRFWGSSHSTSRSVSTASRGRAIYVGGCAQHFIHRAGAAAGAYG
jgi:hypothetical protein